MGGLATVAALLRALGDETRLRILHVLWRSEPRSLAVGELVDALHRPQPAVSRHLAYLRRNGLVRCIRRGRERCYALANLQSAEQRTLLGALEELVPQTPTARRDLERLAARQTGLTASHFNATQTLHGAMPPDSTAAEEETMTLLLGALSHPTRRRLLDDIAHRAGASLGEVVDGYATSRAAIGKHLAVLERAGLVVSIHEAGRRRLYANRVPVQLVYDRWMTRRAAPLSQYVAAIKAAVEEGPI